MVGQTRVLVKLALRTVLIEIFERLRPCQQGECGEKGSVKVDPNQREETPKESLWANLVLVFLLTGIGFYFLGPRNRGQGDGMAGARCGQHYQRHRLTYFTVLPYSYSEDLAAILRSGRFCVRFVFGCGGDLVG